MDFKRFPRSLALAVVLAGWLASACSPTQPVSEETVSPELLGEEQPIYLALIWHQHQPVYYKDPETGLYIRPWVRMHAAKDYVDMAAMLKNYPAVHATFNLTPSLIAQLDDYAAGAKDLYWHMAEIPADQLSDEDKQFILDRFFDTNREIIGRFPRYQELLALRDGSANAISAYSEQDFRDLQVLFNLAWTDPDWLAEEPLATLVAKGENFAEADKEVVFAEHLRLIEEVVPLHHEMQESGQIEVSMTPFAHPILPLLVNTQLARVALPQLELPTQPFIYGQDAVAQVELGVQAYEEHFGTAPRGMWPAEGSVAQEMVTMVSQAGLQWMASDDGVLAQSLGMESFERAADDTVLDADQLYRPYSVQGLRGDPVAILFRDVVLSDKVGFTYSGMDGDLAAQDVITRLHTIRQQLIDSGAEGPHLVTILLDGENAWEYYPNDGKHFLNALYADLSVDPLIQTVTPSEFLAMAPDPPAIDNLWAGSWINHDFATWIGEEEENAAWDLLAETRSLLQSYISGRHAGEVTDEQLNAALLQMYIAEGSDWFWWYGADQNSGNDDVFDEQFRATLAGVYDALGLEPPELLAVPIIAQAAASADRAAQGLISPAVDGVIGEKEWTDGGQYLASGGAMASASQVFEQLLYGFDAHTLYLAGQLATMPGDGSVEIYLSIPGGGAANSFSLGGTVLGFPGELRVELQLGDSSAQVFTAARDEMWTALDEPVEARFSGNSFELALPLERLGGADTGAQITLAAFYQEASQAGGETVLADVERIPSQGPAQLAVPDLGNIDLVLDVADPEGDDYGPGPYTYPTDAVFNAGNFDILNFQVGQDADNIIFKFVVRGPVDNAWDSPNGLSLQTFDIYMDQDGDGQGGKALLPGRNLALEGDFAWDFAVHVEGWTPGIYMPTADDGISQIASSSEFQVLVDPGQRKVTIRVPKSILGNSPADWSYAAVVMSQEGYPSGGVLRVRDVQSASEQWRIGGAPDASNATRVMDLVWREAGMQEQWLSDFTPMAASQSELGAADFALIRMLSPTP